jgi:PAT family beta-lactamase induction signal transducer AmpG
VAVEQFGYGFGFAAYLLYMIHIARGEHATAHYAICTGFMALGMMVPGMWSGWLQELIGYRHFFVWVILATVPSFIVVLWLPLDREFGRKTTG